MKPFRPDMTAAEADEIVDELIARIDDGSLRAEAVAGGEDPGWEGRYGEASWRQALGVFGL